MKRTLTVAAVAVAIHAMGILFALPTGSRVARIKPKNIEFDVSASNSTHVPFIVDGFSGELDIRLQGMGMMRVFPQRIRVEEASENMQFDLTFYGAPS
ncbi:MAG: hypothetical protein JRK26_22365 [Deltaproteobacteria bacterium]|nr:hypothetical protein [Deltaproteobacteria bacterium]